MKFEIEKIEDSPLIFDNKTKNSFKATSSSGLVELKYFYEKEIYYDLAQYKLTLDINGDNVLDILKIDSRVVLPIHNSFNFELLDSTKNQLAILHTEGIIVLNISEKSYNLFTFQTHGFVRSYFLGKELIIVESKCLQLVSLSTSIQKKILFEKSERLSIQGVQIRKFDILIIVRNADLNNSQLLIYNRENLIQIQRLDLPDFIDDIRLESYLDKEFMRKSITENNFTFGSIISSFHYSPIGKNNLLIGTIQKMAESIKKKEYYERVQKYGTIKITLI